MKLFARHSHHNNFDFIRLVAALFVLVTHSYQLSAYFHTESEFVEKFSEHYFPLAYFGVSIFFIISGYLITQSVQRSSSAFDYLKKRIIRIFPGLVTVVVLSIIVLGPFMTNLNISEYFTNPETYTYLKNCLLYKTQAQLPGVFLNNPTESIVNGSLWTLVYEFSFYLVLLFFKLTGLLQLRFVNLLAFFIGLLSFPLFKHIPIFYNYYPSINLSPGELIKFWLFFWSGVVAFLYKDSIRYTGWGALAAIISCVGLIYFKQYILFISLAYVLLPYLIFYLAYLPGALNRFGRYGDFSYGVYIYSFPIQQTILAFYPSLRGFTVMILAIFLVVPLACMSWFWIESPALRWGKSRTTPMTLKPNVVVG